MKRSWSAREWLPNAATLTLIGVTTTSARVVVEADGPPSARCPACDRPSQTRHSRYWRTLKDLAAQGRSVTLRVHVSRWRCGNSHCDCRPALESVLTHRRGSSSLSLQVEGHHG